MKRVLGIVHSTPYGSSRVLEGIEALMVAAAFDQETSILFQGDGVRNLAEGQDGQKIGVRTIGKVVKALKTHEIDRIFVCEASLRDRGLTVADLGITAESLDKPAARALFSAQDAVMTI